MQNYDAGSMLPIISYFILFLIFFFYLRIHQHRSSRSEKTKDEVSTSTSKSKQHSSSHRASSAKTSNQEDATALSSAAVVNFPNQFDPLSSPSALPESGATAGVAKSALFRGSGVICADANLSLVCFVCAPIRYIVLIFFLLTCVVRFKNIHISFSASCRASKRVRARPTRRLSLSPSH